MEPQSLKVAITGATGFTGVYLLKLLIKKGYSVRALRRQKKALPLPDEVLSKIHWVQGDVSDPEALDELIAGSSHVIHNAALISFDPKKRRQMEQINVSGTANVVNACLHHGVEKLIHISSVAALGDGLEGIPFTEKTQWRFTKRQTPHYNLSKFAAECEVWRGFAEGLNGIILNPGVILGSGPWSNGSAGIIPKMLQFSAYYPAGGTGIIDVRDFAKIAVEMVGKEMNHERFILVGHNAKYNEIAALTDKAAGKPEGLRKPLPYWMGEAAWRANKLISLFTGKSPLATKHSIRAASKTRTFDNTKIKQSLSYHFIPLEQTIRETVHDFQSGDKGGVRMLEEF